MSRDGWLPLSQRQTGDAPAEPVLRDGVPTALRSMLRKWLRDYLDHGGHAARVALRLNITATLATEALMAAEGERMLDVVDAALHFHPDITPSTQPVNVLHDLSSLGPTSGGLVLALIELFSDAASAWTVAPSWGALERRVDVTVRQAQGAAVDAASIAGRPEAARDLADAWAKTYGRRPEPSEAYRLAIRAVEDVAIPLVAPKDKDATLGKVRAHLRDAGHKWRLSMSSDVEPLVAMVNLLWTGQTDRHAGQADLARVDRAAAEQAVHLATTLVQWFAAGHVQRVP